MRAILIVLLMTLAAKVAARDVIIDHDLYSCTATTHSSIGPKNEINWKQPTLVFNVQIKGNTLNFDAGSYFAPTEGKEWVIYRGGVGADFLSADFEDFEFALNKEFEEFAFTSIASFLVIVIMGTCEVYN